MSFTMPNVELTGAYVALSRNSVQRPKKTRLSAMLDRLDGQHFIAASLKLVRDALNLNIKTVV